MVTKRSTTAKKRTTTAKSSAAAKTVKKTPAKTRKTAAPVEKFEPMKMTIVISFAAVSILLLFGTIVYYY